MPPYMYMHYTELLTLNLEIAQFLVKASSADPSPERKSNDVTVPYSIQSLCTKKHVFVKINVTGSTAMKTLVCKLYRPVPWNFHSLRNFPTN